MIRHISAIAEIVDDMDAAVAFYRDTLGIPVEYQAGQSYAPIEMPGVLHFAIWSRRAAAEATFGDPDAVDRVPLGFTVGFEVDDVSAASQAIATEGLQVVQPPKKEPWNQIASRFISRSGALAEVTETPWARRITQALQADGSDSAAT